MVTIYGMVYILHTVYDIICTHAYSLVYMHSHACSCMCMQSYAFCGMCMHIHANSKLHTYLNLFVHDNARACIRMCMRACARVHARVRTRIQKGTRIANISYLLRLKKPPFCTFVSSLTMWRGSSHIWMNASDTHAWVLKSKRKFFEEPQHVRNEIDLTP